MTGHPRSDRHAMEAAAEFLASLGTPEAAEHAENLRAYAERTRRRPVAGNPGLSLYVNTAAWAEATKEAERTGVTVTQMVDRGFDEFLSGRFVPPAPVRARRGTADRTSGTVRATPGRRAEITAYAEANAERIGWTPSPQQVAVAWLEHLYVPI